MSAPGRSRRVGNGDGLYYTKCESFAFEAVHVLRHPTASADPPECRLADLPRQAQFLLLTLRLARELSVEDRNFQGFVYTLCGISRVERALVAIGDVLQCLSRSPRGLTIASTVADDIADGERRLLELLCCRGESGLALAGRIVPYPADEVLVRSLKRLAETLE